MVIGPARFLPEDVMFSTQVQLSLAGKLRISAERFRNADVPQLGARFHGYSLLT
jgi:hypothetical protein